MRLVVAYHLEGYTMRGLAFILAGLMLVSVAGFVSAHSITVDGNPTDWLADTSTQSINTWQVYTAVGEGVFKDNTTDYRTDNGAVSSWADIDEFRVTSDSDYVYFLITFTNLSGVGTLGTNGGTFLAIAINDGTGTGTAFAGNSDTYTYNSTAGTGMEWKYQVVINLAASNYSGLGYTSATVTPDTNWGALFYIVNDSWNFQQPSGALMAVSLPNNAIEIRLPRTLFSSTNLQFEVMAANGQSNYANNVGGTWDIGGSSISNAVDVVTDVSGNTWNEVSDGVVDYYVSLDVSQVPFFGSVAVVLAAVLGMVLIFRRR